MRQRTKKRRPKRGGAVPTVGDTIIVPVNGNFFCGQVARVGDEIITLLNVYDYASGSFTLHRNVPVDNPEGWSKMDPDPEYLRAVDKFYDGRTPISLNEGIHTDSYDIIVSVHLHGATVTQCPREHLPNFANATILEATPCGTSNFCNVAIEKSIYRDIIQSFRRDPIFIPMLREGLIQRRNEFILAHKRVNSELYNSKSLTEYRNMNTPWRVLDKGYMERRYEANADLHEVLVNYAEYGPFTVDQDIYESTPFETRTQLMDLLKTAGYKKPLILDFSCGGFEPVYNFTPETIKEKQAVAVELGVGGTKRRTKRIHNINQVKT